MVLASHQNQIQVLLKDHTKDIEGELNYTKPAIL